MKNNIFYINVFRRSCVLVFLLSHFFSFVFSEESTERYALVKAEVVDTKKVGESVLGSMKILHVYRGRENFNVDHFQATSFSADELPDFGRYEIVPELEVGEIGIWTLTQIGPDVWTSSMQRNEFNVPFTHYPARMGADWKSDNYDNVVGIAELSESIFEGELKSELDAQLEVLKRIVREGDSYEAQWALYEICDGQFPEAEIKSFLTAIISNISALDVEVQVSLDKLFCEYNIEGWVHSERRLTVLKGWIGNLRDYSRSDVSKIKTRLYRSHKRGELNDAWLRDLFWRSLEIHDRIKVENILKDKNS